MQKSFDTGNVGLKFAVFITVASLAVDLLSKNYYKDHALPQGSYFFGWLGFTFHQNFGLLGDLRLPYILLILLNIAAFAALAYGFFWAWKKRSNCEAIFLALILGGALGNLYDRVVHGYVFDWILLFKTSIINLADIWISLGVLGYLICLSTAGKKSTE